MICCDAIVLMVLERLKFALFTLVNVSLCQVTSMEGFFLPLTPLLTLFTVLTGCSKLTFTVSVPGLSPCMTGLFLLLHCSCGDHGPLQSTACKLVL